MRNFRPILTMAVLTLLAANGVITTAQAQKDIQVAVAKIQEYRAIEFIKDPTRKYPPQPGNITVVLRLKGKDVANATRVGFIKWTSVTDDSGKSLGRGSSYSIPTRRMGVLRRQNLLSSKSLKDTEHDFTVTFPLPSRSAKAIRELKGEFKIRLAKTVTVNFPLDKVKAAVGKPLDDPMLKKLGLMVNIESVSSSGATSVRAKITGEKRPTFLELRLVDSQGKKVNANTYGFEFTKYTSASVSTFKKIAEGVQLQVVVETEYEDFPIKIDLKDIPLP